MLSVLSVEIRKLNRSLALLLAALAPALIGVFVFFNLLRGREPFPWALLTQTGLAIWAFFLLPMTVTALTALVAHMEHGPRAWDHLRALPVRRRDLYAAKAICVLGLVVLMTGWTLALTWGAGWAAGCVKPEIAPAGALDVIDGLRLGGLIVLASVLMVAIQFWVALRFASFVPALAVGIGGTFFAVVAASARLGVFFPWTMAVNMLATEPWRAHAALGLGAGLGAAALLAAIAHLGWREVR